MSQGYGRSYDQQVMPGGSSTLASAPAGHGLGIAHLTAVLPPNTGSITVTVL